MKKVLVATILGLAAVASVKAQGYIRLANYNTATDGQIVYGAGSGGTLGSAVDGAGVNGPITVGFYYVVGSVVASVDAVTGGATSQGGANNGSMVGSGLNLATGSTAIAPLGTQGGYAAGSYENLANFIVNPSVSATVQTLTVVVVAYNGADYESSLIRGHSGAFLINTSLAPETNPNTTGAFTPGSFALASVGPVPEPSTFALAGLGLAGLLIFRRRK